MGGGRDYKAVMVVYKDENGNPVFRDNGTLAMKRKYIRVTDYKRKSKARNQAQENARDNISRAISRLRNSQNRSQTESLETRIKNAHDIIDQTTDKKSLTTAMKSIGLGDKASFVKEMKNIDGAKEIAKAMVEMKETFGDDVISDITTKGTFGSGVGGYRTVGSTVLHVNPKWFNDPEHTQHILDASVEKGHFRKGENLQSLVKHEYGHLLQDKLTKEVRNTDQFKNNASKLESERNKFNKLISNMPVSTQEKINEYLDKAFHADTSKTSTTNLNKAIKLLRDSDNYWEARSSLVNQSFYVSQQIVMLHGAERNRIQQIFNRIGAVTPRDVGIALTGSSKAYAGTSWAEAHAECISDYMTNGADGASATSIRYVQEFAKEIGVKL